MRKLLMDATLAATLFAGDDCGAFAEGFADVCEWRHGTAIESVPSASARSAGKTRWKRAARPPALRLKAGVRRNAQSDGTFFRDALEYFLNHTTRASDEKGRRKLALGEKFVLIYHGPYRHLAHRVATFDADHAARAAHADTFRQRDLRG